MLTIAMFLVLQTQAPSSTTVTVNVSDTQRLQADVRESAGEVGMSQSRASVEWFQALSPTEFLKVVGSGSRFRYDWAGTASGLAEDFQDLRLEGWFIHAFDAHWRGVGYASAQVQFEEGADMGDGASYGGAIGLIHRFGPELSVGALIGGFSRIEDSPFFFVQPHVEWRPSPSWIVRTEARDGFALEATHFLDEAREWAILSRLTYSTRRFRLDEDAATPEGIFEDTRTAILAGFRWQPSSALSLFFFTGVDLGQEFKLETSSGEKAETFESESAAILGLQASFNF